MLWILRCCDFRPTGSLNSPLAIHLNISWWCEWYHCNPWPSKHRVTLWHFITTMFDHAIWCKIHSSTMVEKKMIVTAATRHLMLWDYIWHHCHQKIGAYHRGYHWFQCLVLEIWCKMYNSWRRAKMAARAIMKNLQCNAWYPCNPWPSKDRVCHHLFCIFLFGLTDDQKYSIR